jgi:hypothetical protein
MLRLPSVWRGGWAAGPRPAENPQSDSSSDAVARRYHGALPSSRATFPQATMTRAQSLYLTARACANTDTMGASPTGGRPDCPTVGSSYGISLRGA